ncbi:putative damage-inducible protein DinB [Paenibacillus sp. PastF-3]|uniref:DinB family protein n=1 Tax=Paenibacillus sp. PastF-3 TaxID=2940626 RepID=UPI002476D521|nr:DinB family protein [Paenibacillus sp. PastF-3]MDH6372686.1 putative damage-inducible protein DinB [Paenibacillus sp. PastF-3]
MEKHPTLEMYDYNVWANQTIIHRLKELPKDSYHKDIQSGFSSVAKVVTHIYVVENIWFDLISGRTRNEAIASAAQLEPLLAIKDIEEMDVLYRELSSKNKMVLNSHIDKDPTVVLDHPTMGSLETSISGAIFHIANHGSYHRGNIGTMLRQMDHTSVLQDYVAYLYNEPK